MRSALVASATLNACIHGENARIYSERMARVGTRAKLATLGEMPKKHWRNMREPSLVQPLIAGARQREIEMIDASTVKQGLKHALEAERAVQPGGNSRAAWEALLADARKCTRCDL